jgi:ferredoxin
MIFFSNKDRPFHYGPYGLERLPIDPSIASDERNQSRIPRPESPDRAPGFSKTVADYHAIFAGFRDDEPVRAKAPVPDSLERRMIDIKGAAYFLDASQVGICEMDESCWYAGIEPLVHTHGVVILVRYSRMPEDDSLARGWVQDHIQQTAEFRAFEIAIGVANHIHQLGFNAVAHDGTIGDVDRERMSVLAGLNIRKDDDVKNPFLGQDFALAVVTTDYELECDKSLSSKAMNARGLSYWLGIGGATSGLEWRRRSRRATHLSNYPMETVKRVDRPTTLIIDDEVPRVPKRAAFFERAVQGDLGKKAVEERKRFSFKHPFAQAMFRQIGAMVPHQDGPVNENPAKAYDDAEANTRAIKSLSYFLGAELTGICKIPEYAWFSHFDNGEPITPYNKYAVVMLIDQGYDTMEGASGDDFISGAQSMRAYMRGGVVAGVMAEHVRNLGYPARPQTNADSHVLHIPLILNAGLGELSRIGELVLNPFVGPRFKSVILTTDLPLIPDKPIDFGLQYFCDNCLKCARECPCDAISWGDKVMFNGYEIWKPDTERCTRYRLTNQRGLACGRCMKTCPLNKVVDYDGPIATQIASWFGIHARPLKPLLVPIATRLDDWLGHGVRNPVKKWWLDLEIVDGVSVLPRKGVNERDLDLKRWIDPKKQKIAYYHADIMPPPNSSGIPQMVDRKAALAAAAKVETPAEALARRAAGGKKPDHYIPAGPLDPSQVADKQSSGSDFYKRK